jgi:serine/threonine-protein kinase
MWGAIAAAVAVIAVVITLVLVIANRDSGAGSAAAPSHTPAPNTGPFTGTFSVDLGPLTFLDGSEPEGGPQKETWNLRSVCGANGCVATAARASGNTVLSSSLVFDDVGGRWLAVGVAPGKCSNADAERWEVFSLQPRPDGALAGEFSSISPAGCSSKRTVTFTRTGDALVDTLNDSASLPARVVSPAQGLHGRYHATETFAAYPTPLENDYLGRTDCLRSGDRCVSIFYNRDNHQVLSFANGKWTEAREADGDCPQGGRSHVKRTVDYPLPQPPQDPIAVLTGRGHQQETGSACTGGDFDEKFVRTGD